MVEQLDFLVEIGTEELPPRALPKLSDALTASIVAGLADAQLGHLEVEHYASPRRLAVLVHSLDVQQPDRVIEKRGPALIAAFDASGKPTKAAQGFAKSCGVTVKELGRIETEKGAWLVFRKQETGQTAASLLPGIIETSLQNLPIPKRMRWGAGEEQFVRPVHWLLMLLGDAVLPGRVLGVEAGNVTYGHRFHHPEELTIYDPKDYARLLETRGRVLANFSRRRELIRAQVIDTAQELGGEAIIDVDLLDEVTALVEWPVALAGRFEEKFLEVPHEALISTMEGHQKYFAVVTPEGRLLPHFITIANIESTDPAKVIEGNERVIRPRFADAAFFWEQDRKQPLESRVASLKEIVFQQKLGTLYDKTLRIKALAQDIAASIGADVEQAGRAAYLSKCDLMTAMVYEFPELQGTAGRYYAEHDGEPGDVAVALEEQYLPRQAGDSLPRTTVGQSLALADKIDTLVGIFGIGQKPSGTKDPFALRRAALGVLRIMIEADLDLDLKALLVFAENQLQGRLNQDDTVTACFDYVLERLRSYYQDQGVSVDVVDAVLALMPSRPVDLDRRVKAVAAFKQLPAAEALAAANKRIGNILKKTEANFPATIDAALLLEPAEQALYQALESLGAEVSVAFDQGEYHAALQQLATLRESVDRFFDEVMVMAEDAALQQNRLALLSHLQALFLRVADLSRLQSAV